MSASEIITVIKAINDHVTNKYSDAIVSYFNEKTNAHILFEREFFNDMDQAVQRLINDITTSLKPTSSARPHLSGIPKNLLGQIQKHCNKYNQTKKNMYDNHLAKLKDFEKKFSGIIQQTLKEKVVHQNNLFDTALQSPVSQQNINQDIVNLLTLCANTQNTQNTQNVQNNAPNTATMNVSNAQNAQDIQQTPNLPNLQEVQNALFTINNIQPPSTTPMQQTSSSPNSQMANNIVDADKLNQINQFLSIISETVNGTGNGTNDTFNAQNGDGNVLANAQNVINGAHTAAGGGGNDLINQNNHNNNNNNALSLSQNILNDMSTNGVSQSQNDNNINNNHTQTDNINNNSNSMATTNFPLLPPLPLNTQNTQNSQNSPNAPNNNGGGLQLKNLIAPIHHGNNRAPLPIQPHKVPTLPAPPFPPQQTNTSNSIVNKAPANILPSFPSANISTNINTNSDSRNVSFDTAPLILGNQPLTNKNGESKPNPSPASNMSNNSSSPKEAIISLPPTAPPKPPPPTSFERDDSSTNMSSNMSSSSDDDDDSVQGYECTLCNKIYETPHQWKSHLKKTHLKTHRKKKKKSKKNSKFSNIQVKKSKHKKSQRKRKRAFSKMVHESEDDISTRHSVHVNSSNKRRRQTFQCEMCYKQYSRLSSYSKHYNHHMVTNENNMCIFCLKHFKNQKELKKHVSAFGAGMLMQDGYFQCCQCTMKFATKNNLQSHIHCVHMKKNKKSLEMLQLFSLRGLKKNDR